MTKKLRQRAFVARPGLTFVDALLRLDGVLLVLHRVVSLVVLLVLVLGLHDGRLHAGDGQVALLLLLRLLLLLS